MFTYLWMTYFQYSLLFQTLPFTATTESASTPRRRTSTKKPTKHSINNAANKPWLIQEVKPRSRSTTTTTNKPVAKATRTGRNSRTGTTLQTTVEHDASNTTKKPFRVYYFEPKRKRTKKIEETTKPATEKTSRKYLNWWCGANINQGNRLSIGFGKCSAAYQRNVTQQYYYGSIPTLNG